MKAALYLRVANDGQSEALSQQEFYLRAWAKKQGYEVTSAFQDVTPGHHWIGRDSKHSSAN